jgi:hypothetical protein
MIKHQPVTEGFISMLENMNEPIAWKRSVIQLSVSVGASVSRGRSLCSPECRTSLQQRVDLPNPWN